MQSLSDITDQDYGRDGCTGPVRVLSEAAAAEVLVQLDNVREEDVAPVKHPWFYKSYLLFTWMNQLVRNPAILDAVAPIVGPDLMVMSADIWRKNPGETRHISFHQDAGYWSLDPLDITTAWVALTPATVENGCMTFALGTHKLRLVEHDNTYAPDNMLSHGQTARIDVENRDQVAVVLQPGEISMHHALLAHGSGPNTTHQPRVGICIRYLPGRIRHTSGPPLSAMLVRGQHHGNLMLEDPPTADLSPEAIAQHTRLLEPHAATRYVNF
ncbi:MAG: phytanoyl-CoA dioxygenase family protein [Alphaproteobacteria bacterium]|jgi:ectoine hydroxylase-related dioxygenase (phytanoyl-CoA dioxygenase family)